MGRLPSRDWKTLVIFFVSLIGSIYLYSVPVENISFASPVAVKIIRSFLIIIATILIFERLFLMPLHTKILLGMLLGGLAGLVFGSSIAEIKPVGTAFIRLIQMIVVPLVLASLLVGTASLGDPKKLGRIGLKTLIYYLASTALAITIGLLLANIVQPGSGLSPEVQSELLKNYGGEATSKIAGMQEKMSPIDTLLNIIPTNPMSALSQAAMLQIIFFAIVSGIALTLIPKEKSSPVITFFEGINDVMIKIVLLVIQIAPYGVFALIAAAVGSFGVEILFSLFKYSIVTIGGLFILSMIYPIVVRLLAGMNPFTFMKGIRPAQLIAFSTSSSGATLPVTMEVCEENLGVSNKIASFVLPLGATVNMDGTALYQGVAAMFIAQVYGIPLDLGDQLTIVLTATLASIGTAAVPGVGLLMLVIVLKQVGIPLEGIALILSVDRILDMFRTTINITSDCTASVIIASSEGELHSTSQSSK